MRIAIDFDDTIFSKEMGRVYDNARQKINRWYKDHEITIFTNRPDWDYSTVKAILDQEGIYYHRIICGKPSYDLFIDDKATKFEGWNHEYPV